MSTLHDIGCPRCGEAGGVIKEDLDTYRCTECDHQFSIEDIA